MSMMGILDIFNEQMADKIVIKNLLREIRRLKNIMGKILFDENGKLYKVHSYEEVTAEDLQEEVDKAKAEIAAVEKVKSVAAQVEQSAGVPATPVQPALPPVDQPVQPATPEVPAAPVAPTVDPNQSTPAPTLQ